MVSSNQGRAFYSRVRDARSRRAHVSDEKKNLQYIQLHIKPKTQKRTGYSRLCAPRAWLGSAAFAVSPRPRNSYAPNGDGIVFVRFIANCAFSIYYGFK
jgi:hypothetical protein